MYFKAILFILMMWCAPAWAEQNFHAQNSYGGNITEILRLAERAQWDAADRMAANLPAAQRDVYRWKKYREDAPNIDFDEVASFIRTHDDWPLMDGVRLSAEKVIPENLAADKIIAWFSDNAPQTAKGMNMYARALKQTGQSAKLQKTVKDIWADASFTRDQQREFYAEFGRYINTSDHKKRINALIDRGEYAQAHGVAALLGEGYQAVAQARIALANQEPNADSYVSRVPPEFQNDEGLLYERLRWRRRNDLDAGAIEILAKEPAFGAKHAPEEWWKERQMIARRLIENKEYGRAYNIAKNHRQKDKAPLAEAEWLAGWLALEYLNKPWEAFEHFERMYHKVETPISRARGAYWAGRASDALKHPEISQKWYKVAAKETGTFYGQMAADALGQTPKLPATFKGGGASVLTSMAPMVQAAKWLNQAGLKTNASSFLLRIGKLSETPAQYAAAADLADDLGYRHVAIKIAQDAQNNHGVFLSDQSYPSITRYLGGVRDVEWALVHAIIRQESRFDQHAVSGAGARGLMQVMPATAKQVAGKLGVAHQTDWLTARPDHNVTIGTRYIAELLRRFDNNYPMAIAGYNAGPSRSNKWAEEFGDPREKNVDLINWIESIPFTETRNYVQRVLEGVYVYRLKLKGSQKECKIPIHVPIKG